jgi:hypothetical protein
MRTFIALGIHLALAATTARFVIELDAVGRFVGVLRSEGVYLNVVKLPSGLLRVSS